MVTSWTRNRRALLDLGCQVRLDVPDQCLNTVALQGLGWRRTKGGSFVEAAPSTGARVVQGQLGTEILGQAAWEMEEKAEAGRNQEDRMPAENARAAEAGA